MIKHISHIMGKIVALALITAMTFSNCLYAKTDPLFDKEKFIASAETHEALELSMNDCIMLCMRNNTEIKIKRIDPKIAVNNIRKAYGAYEPVFNTELEYAETNTSGVLPDLTGVLQDRSRSKSMNIGFSGKAFTNTEYDLDWQSNTYSSNSRLQRFFPDVESTLSGTITQPVMKDFFGMGADQGAIVIAKQNKEISDRDLEKAAIEAVSGVKAVYLEYIQHLEQCKVGEISLESAKKLYEIVKKRYEKGLASTVELYEAEAEVYNREERVLFFEKEARSSEDNLKLKTNLVDDPEFWNSKIIATDAAVVIPKKVELIRSITEAFVYRPDYKAAINDLKKKDINIKMAKNNLLPTVDLVGTYSANGLGDKYSTALDEIGDGANGSWSMGVNVSVPFGYEKERADFRTAKLEKEKAVLAFSRLQQNIIIEVRDAARNVNIFLKEVKASEKSLEAKKKTYEAAKSRYVEGMVSTKDMVDYQRDLLAVGLVYIQAVTAYNKALIELEKSTGTTLAANCIVIEN